MFQLDRRIPVNSIQVYRNRPVKVQKQGRDETHEKTTLGQIYVADVG